MMVFSVPNGTSKTTLNHQHLVLGYAKISVQLGKQEKVEGKGFSFASTLSYLLVTANLSYWKQGLKYITNHSRT